MDWINVIVKVVLIGGLYWLFAASLSVIFGVMRLVNFAYGDSNVGAAHIGLVTGNVTGVIRYSHW